jgi:hypothetical protein
MITLNLVRGKSTDQGTPGALIGDGWSLFSLELPWKDNKSSISCIPAGQYKCSFCYSPSFKKNLYRLADVPKREGVLIHAGNWAGDTTKGYISNVLGCILLGKTRGIAKKQLAVLNSGEALRIFMDYLDEEPFILNIAWGDL